MKKVLALILALLMCCSLIACGDSDKGGSGESTASQKVADYVKKNEKELIAQMEDGLASSGLTCDSSIKTEGAGFIIDIKIQELEDVDDATKDALQETYDSMSAQFEDALEEMQKELPELEYFIFNVCDKNGDVVAVVTAGKP